MMSSYLTFDLRYDLNIHQYNIIKLAMPMSKYQVFTMKETEVTLVVIEDKLMEFE